MINEDFSDWKEKFKEKELKLHLGCYQKHIKGYINVDCRADINPTPDVVDDCAKLEKFENNSASVIYNSHIIEHFKHREYKQVLKRWYDVLKPGGILRTATPDFRAICECYLYHGDLKPFLHSLCGSQRHDFDYHYVLFDEKLLTESLLEVGFKEVRKYDWRNTDHFYIDDFSQAYFPQISYNTRRPEGKVEGRLISLNLEAIK